MKVNIINMNEVQAEPVRWLWYPYIPYGKITVIQGDPGDGKTTVVLAIAAAVTTGAALPETGKSVPPMSVIFQTAEDGLGDTVKPRLVQSGADCSRVLVIDESEKELNLSGPFSIHLEYELGGAERGSRNPNMNNKEILNYLKQDIDWLRNKLKEYRID